MGSWLPCGRLERCGNNNNNSNRLCSHLVASVLLSEVSCVHLTAYFRSNRWASRLLFFHSLLQEVHMPTTHPQQRPSHTASTNDDSGSKNSILFHARCDLVCYRLPLFLNHTQYPFARWFFTLPLLLAWLVCILPFLFSLFLFPFTLSTLVFLLLYLHRLGCIPSIESTVLGSGTRSNQALFFSSNFFFLWIKFLEMLASHIAFFFESEYWTRIAFQI